MSAFTREHCYKLLENASDEAISNFFLSNVQFQRACITTFISQQSYLNHDKDCKRVHKTQSQPELIKSFEKHFGNDSNEQEKENGENKENKENTQRKWKFTDLDFDSLSHITEYLSYDDITHIGKTCSFFQSNLSSVAKTTQLILHTQDGQPLPTVRDSIYLCRFGNLQSLIILAKHDSTWSNMPYGIKRFVDDVSLYCVQLKELLIVDILKHEKHWKPIYDKHGGSYFRPFLNNELMLTNAHNDDIDSISSNGNVNANGDSNENTNCIIKIKENKEDDESRWSSNDGSDGSSDDNNDDDDDLVRLRRESRPVVDDAQDSLIGLIDRAIEIRKKMKEMESSGVKVDMNNIQAISSVSNNNDVPGNTGGRFGARFGRFGRRRRSSGHISRLTRQDKMRKRNAKFQLTKRHQQYVLTKQLGHGYDWFFMNNDARRMKNDSKSVSIGDFDTGFILNEFEIMGSTNDDKPIYKYDKYVSAHFDSYSSILEKFQMFKSLKRIIITFCIPLSHIYTYLMKLDEKQRNKVEEICILCDELYDSKTLKYDAVLREEMTRNVRKWQLQNKMYKLDQIEKKLAKIQNQNKNQNKNKNKENEAKTGKDEKQDDGKDDDDDNITVSKYRKQRMCKDLLPNSLKVLYLPVFASMNWIINEPCLVNLETLIINDINVDYQMYDCQWDISVASYLAAKCDSQKLKCLYLTVNRYYNPRFDISWALKNSNPKTEKNDNNGIAGASHTMTDTASDINGIGGKGRRPSMKRRLSGLFSLLKQINNESHDAKMDENESNNNNKNINNNETKIYQMSKQLNNHLINLFSMFEKFENLQFITLKCVKSQRNVNERYQRSRDLIAVILTLKEKMKKYGIDIKFCKAQKNVIYITPSKM